MYFEATMTSGILTIGGLLPPYGHTAFMMRYPSRHAHSLLNSHFELFIISSTTYWIRWTKILY